MLTQSGRRRSRRESEKFGSTLSASDGSRPAHSSIVKNKPADESSVYYKTGRQIALSGPDGMDPFTIFVLDCTMMLVVVVLIVLLVASFLWIFNASEKSLKVSCNSSTITKESPTTAATTITPPPTMVVLIGPEDIEGPTMPERPLLCAYHCVEAGRRHARFPHDGLCDFLFYHLDGRRVPLATWEKSRCASKITAAATVAKRTLMGVSVDDEYGEKTMRDLSEDAGIRAVVALWKLRVRHHGVNFVDGDPAYVRSIVTTHLKVLQGFRDLQTILHAFDATHKKQKPLTMLGLQPRNAGTQMAEWTALLQTLTTELGIDLLAVYTHMTSWAPDCVVAGPTILQNTLAQPLPDIETALELMNKTQLGDQVVVLFSLSVAMVKFSLSPIEPAPSGYGATCKHAYLEEYRMSCWEQMQSAALVNEPRVMMGKMGPSGQPCLWETKDTVRHKVDYVSGRYKRARFGWFVDRIEKADMYDSCRDAQLPGGYPLTRVVREVLRKGGTSVA